MEPHPIRLVVEDDLRRSRLTVFFRLILAIPHSSGSSGDRVFFVAILSWFIVLVTGRSRRAPSASSAYVRYSTHLYAYLYLAGNPYPGFVGEAGRLPGRPRDRRARAAEPLEDALPRRARAPGLPPRGRSSARPSGGGGGGGGQYTEARAGNEAAWWEWHLRSGTVGVVAVAAFLGWFACVAPGADAARLPRPRRLRAPLLGADDRLPALPHRPLPERGHAFARRQRSRRPRSRSRCASRTTCAARG